MEDKRPTEVMEETPSEGAQAPLADQAAAPKEQMVTGSPGHLDDGSSGPIYLPIGERVLEIDVEVLDLWLTGSGAIPELEALSDEEIETMVANADPEEDGEQAVAILQVACRMKPKSPDHMAALGVMLLDKGCAEESVEWFDRLLELAPDDPFALARRAEAYLEMGDVEGARLDAQRVVGGASAEGEEGPEVGDARMLLEEIEEIVGIEEQLAKETGEEGPEWDTAEEEGEGEAEA